MGSATPPSPGHPSAAPLTAGLGLFAARGAPADDGGGKIARQRTGFGGLRRTGDAGRNDWSKTVHPIVRLHSETNTKVLFVNPQFTVAIKGMKEEESRTILDFLFRNVSSGSNGRSVPSPSGTNARFSTTLPTTICRAGGP